VLWGLEGEQRLWFPKFPKFPKFLDQIDAISPKEIKDVAARMFRSDKPITVTTLGDASQLPRDISIE
jgi:predicted Zn-dependent peptidase